MSVIFANTYLERGSWRGWLKNGQVFEVSWPRASVGIRCLIHEDRRLLWLGLGVVQFFIPIGRVKGAYTFGDEPSWGIDVDRYNIVWHWNRVYKSWRWPFHTITLDHSYMTGEGLRTVPEYSVGNMPESEDGNPFWNRPEAFFETHPYTYKLKRGEVQNRKATILHERWTHGRNILSKLGWPSRTLHAISVNFDDEVGERTGTWKGGTVGCGYNMIPGETPLATLRRMEKERKF